MRPVHAGGNEGRLGEECGMVIASAAVACIGKAGYLGQFVAADALLARPYREELPAHIKRRKLLAAAGDMLTLLGVQTQPDAVYARVAALSAQAQQPAIARDAHGQRPLHVRVSECKRFAVRRRKAQSEALRHAVVHVEVAAVHFYALLAAPGEYRGALRRVQQQRFAAGSQAQFAVSSRNVNISCHLSIPPFIFIRYTMRQYFHRPVPPCTRGTPAR